MFTGIVETTAAIARKTDNGLLIERPSMFDDIKEGASIAVNGVCLSLVELDGATMRFDIVRETWNGTKLGDLEAGDRVNLERSLKADARFEGHVMQGHVDGVGDVTRCILQTPHSAELAVRIPADLLPLVIHKGSIAIEGVSLTVAMMERDICTIALIPHTLDVTTLGFLKEGDRVNIETDILGRYAYAMLNVHR